MLRLEQFEGDLFLLTIEAENFQFSGLFQMVEKSCEGLIPSPDGMKLVITWEE